MGFQGVKSLLELWSWVALNRPDGNLGSASDPSGEMPANDVNDRSTTVPTPRTTVRRPLDEEDIEIAAKWPGEPGLLVKTLVELGWLDRNEHGYILHEWLRHNPWAAGADHRGNKARLSRMAKTHPEIYQALRRQGMDGISAEEFARLKAEYVLPTTVERTSNDRRTIVGAPLTPSPSPSPSPYETRAKSSSEPLVSGVVARGARGAPVHSNLTEGLPAVREREGSKIPSPTEQGERNGDCEVVAMPVEPATTVELEWLRPTPGGSEREVFATPSPVEQGERNDDHGAGAATVEPSTTVLPALVGKALVPVSLTPFGPPPVQSAGRASTRKGTDREVWQDLPPPPPWLPESAWERWQAHRRAIKKPLTPDGARITLLKLEKAKGYGHDPVRLIEDAIEARWTGCVFAEKHFQPSASVGSREVSPPRNGRCRLLREPLANPVAYRKTDGFATELEVPA